MATLICAIRCCTRRRRCSQTVPLVTDPPVLVTFPACAASRILLLFTASHVVTQRTANQLFKSASENAKNFCWVMHMACSSVPTPKHWISFPQAEALIRARLEQAPDEARLWCALGDLRQDDGCYRAAWERSGRRSARAQRSLARRWALLSTSGLVGTQHTHKIVRMLCTCPCECQCDEPACI